jgi:hypothetical protein
VNKKLFPKSVAGLQDFIELLKRTGVPEELIRKAPRAKKHTPPAPPLFTIGKHSPRPRVSSDSAANIAYAAAAAASPKRSKRISKKPKKWIDFD